MRLFLLSFLALMLKLLSVCGFKETTAYQRIIKYPGLVLTAPGSTKHGTRVQKFLHPGPVNRGL